MTNIIHALYRFNGSVEKRYYLFFSFNWSSMFAKWKKKVSMRQFGLSLKKLSTPNNNYWMLEGDDTEESNHCVLGVRSLVVGGIEVKSSSCIKI